MAQFEGTIEDFTKYIGPFARNKVQYITRKYKKSIGKCENCGTKKNLESAHVIGKSRPEIISNILQNYFENEYLQVDLTAFEEQYVDSHLPIERTIKVLCKECHKKYDRDYIPKTSDKNNIESEKIKMLLSEIKLKKSDAIRLLKNNKIKDIDSKNCVFSNINKSKDVYWLEPINEKFKEDLFIILNDSMNQKLHLFKIGRNQIRNPEQIFEQRIDKYSSKLIIPFSETCFKDSRGYDFSPHLLISLNY